MSSTEKQNKFYVVWKGRVPGIYLSWDDCKEQVHKFDGAKFKSFLTREEAEHFFKEGYDFYLKARPNKTKEKKAETPKANTKPILNSICVDAACSGNPGAFEYRGVHTHSKRILFQVGPIPGGTNNIGEFLAIVHILALLKKHNRHDVIYSDSMTAIYWVKNKKANTTIEKNHHNKKVFDMIEKAEKWLQKNKYQNKILKWETRIWGQIIADYGRK